MKKLWCLCLLTIIFIINYTNCFVLFPMDTEMEYTLECSVILGALPPHESQDKPPIPAEWKITGKLFIQRKELTTLSVVFKPTNVNISDSEQIYDVNSQSAAIKDPFKILLHDEIVSSVVFKINEPIWSANIKRAIASVLQLHGIEKGAFVITENSLNGYCRTDYYVMDGDEELSLKVIKTPMLETCNPFIHGVHSSRSILPSNPCNKDYQENVIVTNEGHYTLNPHPTTLHQLYIANALVKSFTTVHTFESTGEAQYISSEIKLSKPTMNKIRTNLDVETDMSPSISSLQYINSHLRVESSVNHVKLAEQLLNKLVDSLEEKNLNFNSPYDDTTAEIFRIIGHLDEKSLRGLFNQIDIGTSYRQETCKNLFLEILPRIGTKASIVLIQELVTSKKVKSTTAVQLITTIPFHFSRPSQEIVKICESFLTLGPDRPDVKHAALLAFASLVFKTYSSGQMTSDIFEKYVKIYFDLFLGSTDYEQQMLYVQALGNLQLGNVAQYLEPIIKDPTKNEDLRYLAMWATMSSANTRPEKTYEIFWPIFVKKTNSIQLRITAFMILLTSNPTPGRLMSLHRLIQEETSSHLINFYRTTVLSISESTYPCFQDLRRLLLYMSRHLPDEPESRFWVTGNYIFDYKDNKFGTLGMVHAMMIGDEDNDVPVIGYFNFEAEALGKFTTQIGFSIKARGVSDSFFRNIIRPGDDYLNIEKLLKILQSMKITLKKSISLHLEFIFQIEGKTILSYYLNETTLQNLNAADITQRITALFQADSHVNMQIVRWPFMTKYHIPTVFGTPIDVIIQNTVITTIRGNMTQLLSMDKISRTNEIDIRYSAYTVCGSESYNPFLNLDHIIRREQGFLLYVPLNTEFSAALMDKSLGLSFFRPENLLNGFSLKSRTLTKTQGEIEIGNLYKHEIAHYGNPSVTTPDIKKIKINDYGLEYTLISTNTHYQNYLETIMESDTQENTKVLADFPYGKFWLKLFSAIHLNSIHLGTDKNFQILVKNERSTLIEFIIKTGDKNSEGSQKSIDFEMNHKKDSHAKRIEHKWTISLNYMNSHDKLNLVFQRKDYSSNDKMKIPGDFRLCINSSHSPMIFMQTSEVYDFDIVFGYDSILDGCPADLTKIFITAERDISPIMKRFFKEPLDNVKECPTDMLKFIPPPYDDVCTRMNLKDWSTLGYYKLDTNYTNLPKFLANILERISIALSSILPDKIEMLDFNDGFQLSVETQPDTTRMNILINDREIQITNYFESFDILPNINYETDEQQMIDYGFLRSCSIINDRLNTFDKKIISLKKYLNANNNNTCSTLLAADCTENPIFALFLNTFTMNQVNDTDKLIYGLKVYTGGNYFDLIPELDGTNSMFIVQEQQCFNLNQTTFIFPTNKIDDADVKVYRNEDGIIIIEHNKLVSTKIQYNYNNVISIQTSSNSIPTLCGLCNYQLINNKNDIKSFTYCGDQINVKCN